MKKVSTVVLILLICSFWVALLTNPAVKAETQTIIVPDDYSSISMAIENADNGDTILVRSGTYEGIQNQTLFINKTISLIGEDVDNTIMNLHPPWVTTTIFTQTLSGYTNPLVIEADNVTISGFTITSDGGEISVNGKNTQIIGNLIATQLYLQGQNQTFALNNIIATLTCRGDYSYVYKNNAVNCIIGTSSGSYASIFSNTVLGGGIGTGGTSNNAVIYDNIVKDGSHISLGSSGNIVTNNTITNSTMGVAIYWGGDNTISRNVITKCQIGLYKTETHGGNVFYANHIENNSFGAKIAYAAPSAETILYDNNFINNVEQVNTDPTETIGGSGGVPELTRPLIHTGLFYNGTEGNFWSDYSGEDNNQDNIGDNPYVIDEKRVDNYPLMISFHISRVGIQLPEWAIIEPINTVPTASFPQQQSSSDNDTPDFSPIYIRADGSVEGTDKIQKNGSVYTLTGNISGGIQVQKSNIVLDGVGYNIQGNGDARGIDLSNDRGSDPSRPEISNVTVKNMRIINFNRGVENTNTANNTISGNYIADCFTGINVVGSPNYFLIKNNTFVNNVNPISIAYSGGVQVITENSFIDGNFIIVWLSPEPDVDRNYWSDYNGTDANADGIGDTPYVYGGDQETKYIDEHPLMEPVPVIPEFPSWTILPLFLIATLSAIVLKKKLTSKN